MTNSKEKGHGPARSYDHYRRAVVNTLVRGARSSVHPNANEPPKVWEMALQLTASEAEVRAKHKEAPRAPQKIAKTLRVE